MKYMGSKARFTKEILPIILKERKPEQWYVEPFAGGMNVICEVQGNRLANDIHYYLIQMWRELVGGFAGETKTKIGTIRDYQAEAINNVLKQVPKMQGVIFENKPYYELKLPPKSIVYCDPPYEGTSKYKVDEFDHNFFWNWVRNISKQGHTVFVSEYNAPADFECVWQKEAKSSLSANGKTGGNKLSVEKLFKFSPTNVK